MRLNAISPKDNPMDEVLYCFGSAGDFDDSVGQSVGGGRDDSDDSRGDNFDERNKVAKDAGVSRDTIVGSGPGGRNIVTSGDGKTPVKAGRAVEREAEREGVSVEEINRRINDAYEAYSFDPGFDDSDVADSSALDEIAAEFDTIDVEREFQSATDAEFYEDQILRDLRKEDYSAVFDQPTTRAGQQINVDPDASLLQSPAGQVGSATKGKSAKARADAEKKAEADRIATEGQAQRVRPADTGFRFFEETPLVDVLGDDPFRSEEEFRFDPSLGRIGSESSESSDADLASTPRSLAIADLVTAYQSSVFPDQLLGGQDPQNLIDQVEGRGTVGDQRPLSIPEIQNITAELLKNPANRETIDGYALADLEASAKPETTTDLINLYETDPREALRFVTLGGVDGKLQSLRYATTYLESLKKAQDEGRLASQTQKIGSDLVDDLGPDLSARDEEADFLETLGYDYPETFDPEFTGLEMFDPEAQQTRKPSEAPPKTGALKPDEDPRRITETGPDYTAYALDPQATVQRNPAMGFSPYEQLSTLDPETGERVALDFRTSLGGPDNFGEVDFGKFAEPISVFGVDVPNALGVAESIVNTLVDPTGTTERAVYEGGVRSVDGRATGLDTGIDLVTDGTQQVIGGYDRDRNIVYATEGNLFNPALSDFYEEKRRVDELSRDDGDQPQPLAGGLEILPQSTLSAYDFGSSSFDPFSTEAGTGVGSGSGTGSIDSLPAVGAPAFDFMRDFGAFTLSPQPDQMPEGAYSPTYLAPISEMTAEERQGLVGLLGTPLGAELGLSNIDLGQTPTESAEALIRGLSGDQSV